ncbi:MAG: hypothetical protein LDL26_11675 [Caenispirillum bisanense]|nr:hypothetical protein [Caenispirillum bisanense]MCA1974747.1 hypothetical protein [Caenispirillum sp.]
MHIESPPPSGSLTPVLYVQRDETGRWVVRCEGEPHARRFTDRKAAARYARETGEAAGGYRLFLEMADGRLLCEMLNVAHRRDVSPSLA